jgi:hypothetical protein
MEEETGTLGARARVAAQVQMSAEGYLVITQRRRFWGVRRWCLVLEVVLQQVRRAEVGWR